MLAVVSVTGCGKDSRPSDLPRLFPCAITITQEGNPLNGATVSLEPIDEANAKYRASSVTDDSGKAVVTTYGFDGVPAGRYKVCVWKTVIDDITQYRNSDGEMVNSNGTDYRTVERQYSDVATTPHEIEVTTGRGTTQATFDVGKPVKERKM